MNTGFICTDLDKEEGWPRASSNVRSCIQHNILSRRIYNTSNLWRVYPIKMDKKTKQWWGKFVMSGKYYHLHVYLHHVLRQEIIYLNNNPGLLFYNDIKHRYDYAMKITEQCIYKPKR